jgi:hypothetical protein
MQKFPLRTIYNNIIIIEFHILKIAAAISFKYSCEKWILYLVDTAT